MPGLIADILQEQGVDPYRLKRALLVDPAQDKDILEFFDTVSANRMQHTELFHDMEKTESWLLDES